MSLENISTFEHDVKKELEAKEATTRTVAAAKNDVGNKEPSTPTTAQKKSSPLPLIGAILIILILAAGGGYVYFTYAPGGMSAVGESTSPLSFLTSQSTPAPVTTPTPPPQESSESIIRSFSPLLANAIGQFTTGAHKTPLSLSIEINNFPQVYSYLLRNEKYYIEEVAKSLNIKHDFQDDPNATKFIQNTQRTQAQSSTTKPQAKPQANSAALLGQDPSASLIASSSFQDAVAIAPVDDSAPQVEVPFTFSDMTINNQNIRVVTSGKNTFYYAFIGKTGVIFAATLEELFTQKSAILH